MGGDCSPFPVTHTAISTDYGIPVVWNPASWNGTQTQRDAMLHRLLAIPPLVRDRALRGANSGGLLCAVRGGNDTTLPPYNPFLTTFSQGGTTWNNSATVTPEGFGVVTGQSNILHEACHYINSTSGNVQPFGFYDASLGQYYGNSFYNGRGFSGRQLELHPTSIETRLSVVQSSYIGHPFVSYAGVNDIEWLTETMASWFSTITRPSTLDKTGFGYTCRDKFVLFCGNSAVRASRMDAIFRAFLGLGATEVNTLTTAGAARWDAGVAALANLGFYTQTQGGWTLPAAASWTPPGF